jgi:xanthosine utilization system XapX-like protein
MPVASTPELPPPVVAALIALSGVMIGWLVTALIQRSMDKSKAATARADSLARETSASAQQLTINAATALHSMCWLTWLAEKRPGQFSQQHIDNYNEEMHKTLPKISAHLATVAALDMRLYDALNPLVEDIYALDEHLGKTAQSFSIDKHATTRDIGAKYDEIKEKERSLAKRVGNQIGAVLSAKP